MTKEDLIYIKEDYKAQQVVWAGGADDVEIVDESGCLIMYSVEAAEELVTRLKEEEAYGG